MTNDEHSGSGHEGLHPNDPDGIREYDNPMPGWWVWAFRVSFWFAVCYFLWFQVFAKGSVAEDYTEDMREFRADVARRAMGSKVTEEGLEKLMGNAAVMSDARMIFQTRCVPCHGQDAQGVIGPNLTDEYWLHGRGTLLDIYGVVNEGVPAKGMPTWGRQLPPMDVAKLAAFVGTLRNRHVPGKAPEGIPVDVAPARSGGGQP